jgi:Type II secretion system (T2SS), protein E, N-terminal domain
MTSNDATRPDESDTFPVSDATAITPPHPLELALRSGLRYSALRDIVLDPRLLLYVALELCERETVLPISVSDEVLEVATARRDPDLGIETRFPELEIDLVLAPIERILELQDELKATL